MTIAVHKSGNTITLKIVGTFNFSDRNDFRKATRGYDDNTRFVLDFREVKHIDSCALGMLLILREMAGGEKADITLTNCSKETKSIFQAANFEKLFQIRYW